MVMGAQGHEQLQCIQIPIHLSYKLQYMPILYHFRDELLVESCKFLQPHVYMVPLLELTP